MYESSDRQFLRGVRTGLIERPAFDREGKLVSAGPSAARGPLPAKVGLGNLMVATWVIGRAADPKDLGEKLVAAPFDLIVLVRSSAVAGTEPVFKFLTDLAVLQSLSLIHI